MKVVHVGKFYPPRWGGMETALKDLCEMSVAAGVEVEALVAHEGVQGRCEALNDVIVRRMGTPGMLFSQPITPAMPLHLSRSTADLVHLHEPNPLAAFAWFVSRAKLAGTPLLVHYHSDIVKQKQLARLYRPLQSRMFRSAAAIIVGSAELLESSAVLAPWRAKCEVIPFGIDLTPYVSLRRRPRRSGPPRILAVGRPSYYKGFQYLITAMQSVDAELQIAGEGELQSELDSQIRQLGLASRVTLAGRVSETELLDLYQSADIFCFPSCERSEAFGLVQVEAMGAGLPVVATDLPTGARSVSVPGKTGLRVPPGDPRALARALRQLCENPELAARMGAAARQRAIREYSREAMGERVHRLYDRVLGRQHSHVESLLEPVSGSLG
jgi:rhamnosyl/mannosyltransferase